VSTQWKKLNYHPVQAKLWRCAVNREKRFIAAVAGRGSGKTELARRFVALNLSFKRDYDPIYAYCMPTFAQARKVAWYPLLDLIPSSWIAHNGINKSESSVTTRFGSTLYIVGMDKPHRLEGLQLDGCILDESSDQKPGIFARTIVPMLTHRQGWCWRIGVPKKNGVGRVEYRTFFEQGLEPDSEIASFHWKSSEILTPQQLAEVKSQLDPQEYAEQFEAQWIDAGGSVYHNYSRENILDVRYDPNKRIIVGCDFNVSPMAWVLCQQREPNTLQVFDEIFLRDANTQKTLDFLHSRYSSHNSDWTFIGDASARARKTSANRTDYLIIKNDIRFGNKRVLFPGKNPKVQDRVACVNAALCNAAGEYRLHIHPRCKKLLNDFMIVSYKEGKTEVENYDGTDIGHTVDALGYAVHKLMPIKLNKLYTPQVLTA
jgi:hypothetical protein